MLVCPELIEETTVSKTDFWFTSPKFTPLQRVEVSG